MAVQIGVPLTKQAGNGVFVLAPQHRQESPVFAFADAQILENLECVRQFGTVRLS